MLSAQTLIRNGGATHDSVLAELKAGAESLQSMIDFLIKQE